MAVHDNFPQAFGGSLAIRIPDKNGDLPLETPKSARELAQDQQPSKSRRTALS